MRWHAANTVRVSRADHNGNLSQLSDLCYVLCKWPIDRPLSPFTVTVRGVCGFATIVVDSRLQCVCVWTCSSLEHLQTQSPTRFVRCDHWSLRSVAKGYSHSAVVRGEPDPLIMIAATGDVAERPGWIAGPVIRA